MKKVTLTLSRLAAIAATSTFCLLATSCGGDAKEKLEAAEKATKTAEAAKKTAEDRAKELEGKTTEDLFLELAKGVDGPLVMYVEKDGKKANLVVIPNSVDLAGMTTAIAQLNGVVATSSTVKNFGKTIGVLIPAAAAVPVKTEPAK